MNDKIINQLVSKNSYFYQKEGRVVTLDELLTKKMGRLVSYDEAIAYLRKYHFISRLKQLA